jgi:hypothetical protein
MGAGGYFTLALLIVLLLPTVVLAMEGRRSPDALYALIAICGLMVSAYSGGSRALVVAIASALGVLLVTGTAVTMLRSKLRLRILTGGQIKLMAAGAAWLGPWGTVLMMVLAIVALFAIAMWRQLREGRARTDPGIIVATAIAIVALQQNIPSGLT